MGNTIKIKRRPFGQGAAVPSLVAGELAYSEADGHLYYGLFNGSNTDAISIGGSGYIIDKIGSIAPASHAITTHTANNWKLFYSDDTGMVKELALATSGQVLKSNGANAVPSFQADNDTTYSKATDTTLGLFKIFDANVQTENANSVTNTSGKTYGIQFDSNDKLVVNVPWTDTNTVYTHPTHTAYSIASGNGKVLSAIEVNNLGHVTGVFSKTLVENDIPTLSQSKISGLTTDLSSKLDKSGGTMTGYLTLSGIPTNANHAATKGYVDTVKQGLDIKDSVRVATTENLSNVSFSDTTETLSSTVNAALTIDGITLASGDRFLVKNAPSSSLYFGIFKVTAAGNGSTPWQSERAIDATQDKLSAGSFTFVTEGNTNGDTGWVLIDNDPINVYQDQVWSQFSAAGQIYDGSGLLKVGNIIHVGQGDGISVLTDSIAVNNTVVRTTGVQTITGEKDFENNLKIKPIYNSNGVGWFPAFNVEPSGSSQKMVYMTKADLVTALSFETPELGNSFVSTTGNQIVSGVKRFLSYNSFEAGHIATTVINGQYQPIGNINLLNSTINYISYNASGVSSPPINSASFASGTKLVFKPSPLATLPPVSVGLSSNALWHVVPASTWNYEWYAGATKIATLYGNGTFNATNISGTNFYLGGSQITASASEINLLASASDKDILIGSGSDFVKENFITALSGAIISQSGLSVTNTSSNLIINHNLSTAVSTSNPSGYAIDNVYLDNYGHITGVRSINLDERYLTSANLNSQITFTSGINSSYSGTTLTVFHNSGQLSETSYGVSGIKTITLDKYGHISGITTANYVEVQNLCSAISGCTIDGGEY
jgi:hypothetical protein